MNTSIVVALLLVAFGGCEESTQPAGAQEPKEEALRLPDLPTGLKASNEDQGQAAEQLAKQMQANQAVFAAFDKGDLAPVFAFLQSVRSEAAPATHLLAGNFLFALGEPRKAYDEHLAAMESVPLVPLALWEAVVDLLAMRRFPEACQLFTKLPPEQLKGSGTEAIHADLLLRCGQPEQALRIMTAFMPDRHSSAEEGLATVFGEQQRFAAYRLKLEQRLASAPGEAAVGRALGELLLCGDFSNPWQPRHHYEEAIQTFGELGKSAAGGCAVTGRAAVAEMLRVERASRGSLRAEDLRTAWSLLEPLLRDGPACEEVAEAHYLYLDMVQRQDTATIARTLRQATARFPNAPYFRRLLLDLYRLEGTEADHRGEIEEAIARFPTDWFAYSRLAALEVQRRNLPGAVQWLKNGLNQAPDSLPLNYLLGMLYLKDNRFDDATQVAARHLASLMETQIHHHDWDRGRGLLRHSLAKESPWPKEEQEAWRQLTELFRGPSVHGEWRAAHGCFSSGASMVATVPEWFKPQVVTDTVAGF